MTGFRSVRFVGALAIFALANLSCMRANSSQSDPPFGIECALRVEEPLRAGGPVVLRFALSRSAGSDEKPVYALRWYTPLEGVRGNFLKVERDGAALAYQGPLVKRGDPSLEDYVEVYPGKPVEGTVDLGPAYDFSRPGSYSIEFKTGLADLVDEPTLLPRSREAHHAVPLACPAVRFELRP